MTQLQTPPASPQTPNTSDSGRPRAVRALRRAAGIFGGVVLTAYFAFTILILALRYALLPHIDHYRGDIERIASHALGQRVTIGAIFADWQGLHPRLALSQVAVYDRQDQIALTLPRVVATLDWETVVVAQLRLSSLEIIAPDITIRRDKDRHLYVGGVYVDLSGSSNKDGFARWILAQTQILVRHASVRWNDEARATPELTLQDVGFVLQRFGTSHRFALAATPPPASAAPLDLRGTFDHALFSDFADPKSWRGQLYLNLEFVDLAAWKPYLDYPIEISQGKGAVRAWLQFSAVVDRLGRPTRLSTLVADVALSQVKCRFEPSLQPLGVDSVSGRVSLSQNSTGQSFSLHHFQLKEGTDLDLPPTNLDATWQSSAAGQTAGGTLQTNVLNLDSLAFLGERIPLTEDARRLLARYRPRGMLRELRFAWTGPLDSPVSFDVSSNFTGLSIASAQRSAAGSSQPMPKVALAPGFSNLSGTASATQKGGTLSLDSRDAMLSFPGVFDEPDIAMTRLVASASWTQNGADLEIHVPTLAFENTDAAGVAQATFLRGPHSGSQGPGFLDLSGQFTHVDATRVVRYLPATMSDSVRHYLQRAILAGRSDDTSFRVHGPLEHFPFRAEPPSSARTLVGKVLPHTPDQFHVDANLRDVKLDYAPPPPVSEGAASPKPWPPFEDVDAKLVFDGARMDVQVQSAHVFGVTLSNVHAWLPDVDEHNAVLQVQGQANGALADLLRFVNASPVAHWIGNFTEHARAQGAAQLNLTLGLPVMHASETQVNGTIQFQNDNVGLFNWLPDLMQTNGRLEFTERGVALHNVTGQFVGGPYQLDATTGTDGVVTIHGTGTLVAAALRNAPELPVLGALARHMEGSAHYRVALALGGHAADNRPAAPRAPRVMVDSDLIGIAIDLPDPVHKPALDAWPFHLELSAPIGTGKDAADQIRLSLGQALSAVLERHADATGEMQITHAGYGVNEPAFLTDAHAYANITLNTLDLNAWQAALSGVAADSRTGGPSAQPPTAAPLSTEFAPDVIAARVNHLKVRDKEFDNVVAAASRNSNGWLLNLSANQIAGTITWHPGASSAGQQNRITARLSRLTIPQSAAQDVNTLLETSPSEIPALDVVADNFVLRDKKLGRLELLASNVTNAGVRQWRLDKLHLSDPDATFDARGLWSAESTLPGSPQHTHMNLTVATSNIGALMDRLGLKGTIKKGSATLKASLTWRGNPLAIDYDSLTGDMQLAANKGQFLKADPGVAKLLGVLSLQGLQRRLTLDFTDLFGSGFAFDSIAADATVSEGIANTSNFRMVGVSAIVAIDGSADLAHETQNLHVAVFPQLNLGAGSIAYAILANPLIGLGTLVAGEVLRDPISKVLRLDYNVSGPWAAPTIVRSDRRAPLDTGVEISPSAAPANGAPAPMTPNVLPQHPE